MRQYSPALLALFPGILSSLLFAKNQPSQENIQRYQVLEGVFDTELELIKISVPEHMNFINQ